MLNSINWTEKQSLVYLFPLIISISFAMDVFVPAIPVMSDFFKTEPSTMQASLYVFMFTVALGQLIVGPLADYYGRRGIAVGSALLFMLGSLCCSAASSLTVLICARILQAAGACGTYLVCFIIIRDNFSTSVCARLFSILCGINAMVASTAPILGGVLLDLSQDWHSGFYFLAVLGLIMCFIACCYIPNYSHPPTTFSVCKTFRFILKQPDFRLYTLVASASLLGLYLFCALSPVILITQLHLSPTQYGLWFGLNAFTVFISNIIAARLSHFYTLKQTVHKSLLWMMCSCLAMIFLSLYPLTVLNFMVPMLCLTIGIGMSMGPAAALALSEFKQQAGTATALLGACQFGLAGFIGLITAQFTPQPFLLAVPVLIIGLYALLKMPSQARLLEV